MVEQKSLYSGKSCCFWDKWLYLRESGCFGKMFEFEQKFLYSGSIVVFGQKWLNSGKSGYLLQSGCILVKWFYSRKSGCLRAKVVVFGQKLLYSGKSGCIRAEWLYSGK